MIEANSGALAPDGQERKPARLRRRHHCIGMLVIDVDDRRGAGLQQILEQPQLGGEISLEARMIIEMIARDIGETASRDAQTVEPVLVEAVRGCLDGEMSDAIAGKRVE